MCVHIYNCLRKCVSNVHMLLMIWLVLMGCCIVLRLGKSYSVLGVICATGMVLIVFPSYSQVCTIVLTIMYASEHQIKTGGIKSTDCKEFRACSHYNQCYAAKNGQVLSGDNAHLNILGAQLLKKKSRNATCSIVTYHATIHE